MFATFATGSRARERDDPYGGPFAGARPVRAEDIVFSSLGRAFQMRTASRMSRGAVPIPSADA